MGEAEATALLQARFAVDGRLVRLATEKDDTFRVETADRGRFVLKIANPAEEPDDIALQVALLRHIAATDPALPVPRVVSDTLGCDHPAIVDQAGQRRHVHCLTYRDGVPLDSTAASRLQRERIGEMLGRLRHAMAGFAHPADRRRLAWDVMHLRTLAPLLDDVGDPTWRAALAEGLHRFIVIEDRLRALRVQVLHNDFSRSNIIVDHAAPGFVTGIIDFGDAVRTAIAIDLSTALVNQLPRDLADNPRDDILAEGRDLVRGYLREADLTEAETAIVPHLVMGRLVARGLLSLWRARRCPDNAPYLLRNTAPGWAQLDWFLSRSPAALSTALLAP